MNLIAASSLTLFAETCWDFMPLRVAIIAYVIIAAVVGLVAGIAIVSSTDGRGFGDFEGFLVMAAIIGLFWPCYLVAWVQRRNTPTGQAAPARTPTPNVSPSPAGFEVVPVAVLDERCSECGRKFGGSRTPIRWRDTRVCPDCREHLRVLD